MRRDAVNCAQEVAEGHVRMCGQLPAVASAVPTVDVTSQRAFPEQLSQGVELLEVVPVEAFQLKGYAEACSHRAEVCALLWLKVCLVAVTLRQVCLDMSECDYLLSVCGFVLYVFPIACLAAGRT